MPIVFITCSLVITVTFKQAEHNVSENGTAQLVLILSKPLLSNFTLEVLNINGTAFGKP